MSEAIIVALITGGLSLTGVVVTCLATAKKSEKPRRWPRRSRIRKSMN